LRSTSPAAAAAAAKEEEKVAAAADKEDEEGREEEEKEEEVTKEGNRSPYEIRVTDVEYKGKDRVNACEGGRE